ncbi:ribonuclease III, partial [Nocardia sp. NPDC058497]
MTAGKDNTAGSADHASLLTALGVDVRPELLRLALTHR